jgi:hypothetical protein
LVRLALFAALTLAGCSSDERRAARPVSARSAQASAPSPPVQPASARGSEALWHLRAGLNVAALQCRGRGRVSVAGAYSQVLSRHRAALAAAYRAEQAIHRGASLDSHMTRVYNRFANQRSPELFCRTSAEIAARVARMSSPELAGSASRLLGELERG